MNPGMSMMPPRGVQPMPRPAGIPANGPAMAIPTQGYGNGGEQLMMVLNGGGGENEPVMTLLCRFRRVNISEHVCSAAVPDA